MTPEQFDQIVEAIIAGKYSWACVLLLRFAGYNPLHYIPYRTYNRLVKENDKIGRPSRHEPNTLTSVSSAAKSNGKSARNCLSQITDLSYLEKVSEEHTQVCGGNLNQSFSGNIPEYNPLKVQSVQDKIKKFLFPTGDFFKSHDK